jgi:hypothetical protein
VPACDHAAVQDGPSRRAVLATGGVLTLSACLPGTDREPSRPDPDLLLRRRVASQVRDLVAAYAAVGAAFPQADARQLATLRALAAEHEAHVTALEPPAAAATPSPSESPSASPSAAAVPSSMAEALRWLAGLERAAARRRTRQALRAGPDLARLLAAVGASEATHADELARA